MSRIFHKGYFNEIFRQLRTAGIVCAGILMLGNFTTLLSILVQSYGGMLPIPSASELSTVLKLFIYVTGFIFTFNAFGWLNKRSSSDFYHAVPVTRTQMYFSTVAAVLLWMFIGLIAFAVVKTLIYLVFGLPFNYLLYLCVVVNMLIACIEVVGAVALACAISGTRFVNFIAALVILFAPRALMTVLAVFVETLQNGTLVVPSMSIFFDPTYNIIASPLTLFPYFYGLTDIIGRVNYANVLAMLYTLAYSLLLIVLGCVAFNKRRSESAGIPTTNKTFQRIIGVIVGLPLLLFIDMMILNEELGGFLILGTMLLIFAFVFYCLYNLISTKSGKRTVKEMPWFLVSVGVALVMLLLPRLIVNHAESIKLEAGDIKGFYLPGLDSSGTEFDYNYYIDQDNYDYSSVIGRKCFFADTESAKLLADEFNSDTHYDYGDNTRMMVRVVRRNGCDITRWMTFTHNELGRLKDCLTQNERYAASLAEFPVGKNYYSAGILNKNDSETVAKIFRQEFESLPAEKRKALNSAGSTLYDGDSFAMLTIYGCLGAENYYQLYRLDRSMPETYAAYLGLVNEKFSNNAMKALDDIIAWSTTGDTSRSDELYFYISLSGNLSYGISRYTLYYDFTMSKKPVDTDPEFCELIKILRRGELTTDIDNAILIEIDHNGYYVEDKLVSSMKTGYAAIKLSDADLARANELLNSMRRAYIDR